MPKKYSIWLILILCTVLLAGCNGFTYSYHYVSGSSSHSGDSSSAAQGSSSSRISVPSGQTFVDQRIQPAFTPVINRFYYNTLQTAEQRAMYHVLLESLLNLKNKTEPVKGSFTREQAGQVITAVTADYPQIYYLYFNYTLEITKTSTTIRMSYLYNDTSRIAGQNQAFFQAVNEILEGAKAYPDMYQRELYLYNTLIKRVRYDHSELETPGSNPNAHSAYGALVEGKAVCEGYARAFQLLCSYAGIESTMVFGKSHNQDHAWNLVWLDGDSYYVDATWDDSEGWYLKNGTPGQTKGEIPDGAIALPEAPTHHYFNISYSDLLRDHTLDEAYPYPTDNNMLYNYFIKENLILTSENWNTKLAEGLRSAAKAGKPFAEFRLGSGTLDSSSQQKITAAISKPLADELGIHFDKVYITPGTGNQSFAVLLIYKSYTE